MSGRLPPSFTTLRPSTNTALPFSRWRRFALADGLIPLVNHHPTAASMSCNPGPTWPENSATEEAYRVSIQFWAHLKVCAPNHANRHKQRTLTPHPIAPATRGYRAGLGRAKQIRLLPSL